MNLGRAVAVEGRKLLASRVPSVIALLLVLGVAALCGAILYAVASGNPDVVAKLGPVAREDGWAGLLGSAVQIVSAGGLIAFGVMLSWSFGREFAEGTITGLFALPVPRASVAIAKLLTYAVWAAAISAALVLVLLAAGFALGYGLPAAGDAVGLARLALVTLLTALIAVPAALAATLFRGLLAGIAVTVALVASAQVLVLSGAGAWYPIATPALWGTAPDSVPPLAFLSVAAVPAVFGSLTARSWARLQLDR